MRGELERRIHTVSGAEVTSNGDRKAGTNIILFTVIDYCDIIREKIYIVTRPSYKYQLTMATMGGSVPRDTEQHLSRDEVFELLSSHRRRYALHAAKQADGPVELSEIAEQVAAWENDKTRSEITSDERHRVYTSMQQTHLPTMDRAGIIEYDNGTVTLTDDVGSLEVYMDVVPEQSIPWSQYYLGLSVFSTGVLVAAWAGIFPEVVPALAWAGLVVALFLVSALYHVWQSRKMRLGTTGPPPEVD